MGVCRYDCLNNDLPKSCFGNLQEILKPLFVVLKSKKPDTLLVSGPLVPESSIFIAKALITDLLHH